MKRIVVLGSTGSIGRNALDVATRHREHFKIVGLAAGTNISLLDAQCREHPEAMFSVRDASSLDALLKSDPSLRKRSLGYGETAVTQLIESTQPDLVLNALVGIVGLVPALYCLENGIPLALANKEAVVAGGEILVRASNASGASIIPVDSEHVAISQCLRAGSVQEVRMIYLTASGGALRNKPLKKLENAGVAEVLEHPTWKMGDKVTVDSATMINKGQEVIEAHWLFEIPFDKIEVVMHPQSVIHSFVEFTDGSIVAQMGVPDMRLPILYALAYPERIDSDLVHSRITEFPELTFEAVDMKRYPCMKIAIEAGKRGGNTPAVLNAANEVAVGAFLAGKISFSEIYSVVESALSGIAHTRLGSLEDVFETDALTRRYVEEKFSLDSRS